MTSLCGRRKKRLSGFLIDKKFAPNAWISLDTSAFHRINRKRIAYVYVDGIHYSLDAQKGYINILGTVLGIIGGEQEWFIKNSCRMTWEVEEHEEGKTKILRLYPQLRVSPAYL